MGLQLLLGCALALIVAVASYRAEALSASGAWAAWAIGSLTFGLGGWPAAALLLAFFVSSSALSAVGRATKQRLAEKFSKDSRRDAGQVLANGSLAAVLAVGFGLQGSGLWLTAMAGALAAANADTWATELGVLSSAPPRRITGGAPVEPGTSGAVSGLGMLAALAGAGLIGLLDGGLQGQLMPALIVTGAGLAGSVADSLLGAAVQAIYWCPGCGRETERHPRHVCGTPTRRVRGWRWLDNDGVNLAATLVGGGLGAGLAALLQA